MYWLDEVEKRLKQKNQILFSKDTELLQELIRLIPQQDHRAIILWALEFAKGTAEILTLKYPGEIRPKTAVESARQWAEGKIKMPEAQQAILHCHAFAKEISNLEDIALCHAVGQACSVVHTSGHAIGYPMYELTAMVRKYGISRCQAPVEKRNQEYLDRLFYWQDHYRAYPGEWAKFLCK